jgi:hypothetical protein
MARVLIAAQIAFGIYVVGINAYGARTSWSTYVRVAPKSPLYVIWTVETMAIDGQIRSPLVTDYDRWRRVIFDRPTGMAFQRMDDSFVYFGAKLDQAAGTVKLTQASGGSPALFRFQRPAQDRLVLDGELNHHVMHMDLRLVDRERFLLVNRGFHWIQEYPFNR